MGRVIIKGRAIVAHVRVASLELIAKQVIKDSINTLSNIWYNTDGYGWYFNWCQKLELDMIGP